MTKKQKKAAAMLLRELASRRDHLANEARLTHNKFVATLHESVAQEARDLAFALAGNEE